MSVRLAESYDIRPKTSCWHSKIKAVINDLSSYPIYWVFPTVVATKYNKRTVTYQYTYSLKKKVNNSTMVTRKLIMQIKEPQQNLKPLF